MEKLTRETLAESFPDAVTSGRIVFSTLDYEKPESAAFADEFKIATAAVVLVEVKNGKTIAAKKIVTEAWELHTDESAFKNMLKEHINAMLQGKILETNDESHEIIFASDDKLPQYVSVLYFYQVPSCETCLLMSKYVSETVETRFAESVKKGEIVLQHLNLEDEQNADLVQKLGIKVPMLAIAQIKDGKMEKAKLARKVWFLAAEKDEFMDYVEKEIRMYIEEIVSTQKTAL
jgi:hypothetical protein